MRITVITGEYPPQEGGVGDFTQQIGYALHALGHEVHVITNLDEEHPEDKDRDLIVHRQVKEWGWSSHSRLKRLIDGIQPEIINIQYQAAAYQMNGGINLFPRWQRRNLEMPMVTTFHDLRPPYLFPKAGGLRQWAVWQMAQYCTGVITTNGEDYTALAQAIRDDPKPQMRLIPIGSNIAPKPPAEFQRGRWRDSHGIGMNDLLVGFFGFQNHSKGIETLLDATALLVEQAIPVHLIFIGGRTGTSDITNRTYAREIDARIDALDLRDHVLQTGFTHPSEVSSALLASDICALPYNDGASLRRGTLHACLAHGLPIVTTTPQVETPQLKTGENVILVPPKAPQALADTILALWDDPDLRRKLGTQAAQLAAEFSWDRIAAHTAEFFRQLIQQPPAAKTP